MNLASSVSLKTILELQGSGGFAFAAATGKPKETKVFTSWIVALHLKGPRVVLVSSASAFRCHTTLGTTEETIPAIVAVGNGNEGCHSEY